MTRVLSLLVLVFALLMPAFGAAQEPVPDAGVEKPDPEAARFDAISSLQDELEALDRDRRAASGEERELIGDRIADKRAKLGEEIVALVGALTEEGADKPPEDTLQEARKLLRRERKRIARDLDSSEEALAAAKKAAAEAESPVDRSAADEQIAEQNSRLVLLLGQKYENAQLRGRLGAKVEADLKELDEQLETRARRLATFIEAAREERDVIRKRPASTDEEKKARQSDLSVVKQRIDAAAASLSDLVDLMKERDLDTTAYQQLLIEATGRVTTDVFDKEVTVGLLGSWMKHGEQWVAERAPQAFFALILFAGIMLISWMLSRLLRKIVRRSVEHTEMSVLAREFLVRSSGRVVLAVGVLTGLSQLGIEMGPVLAGLGIAGFVVGFALQDTLSNFASGLMILVYRPFDVGDLIEVTGVSGTVDQMTLVSTSILTLDNQQLIIPNNKIWNNVIRNVTAQERRRVDFLFGVGYGDDIDAAAEVLRDIAKNTANVDPDAEITVAVHEFGDSSVNFVVRVWTETSNYWQVFWDINAEVKRRFDAEGISIPFPQRDVHIHQDAA